MKILVDTDPGTDDCHAITHLLKLSNVIAITTVFGNATQPQTACNACRILEMLGMNQIPVYNGAQCGLEAENEYVGWEGTDSLNDVEDLIPLNIKKNPEISMTAAEAIIEIVKANTGEITLVALGPLTNIALALKYCPELPTLLKSFYVMGSSIKQTNSNSRAVAEFNFRCDPLAAHLTLEHFSVSTLVHIVPRETSLGNCISFKQYENIYDGAKETPTKAILLATGMPEELVERRSKGLGYRFSDQFISLLLMYPQSVIEFEHFKTASVIHNQEGRSGVSIYVKGETSSSMNKGLIVYTKFDMSCMIELYKQSMKI